jgi:hypothetical protein
MDVTVNEYGKLKPAKVILRRERGKRQSNGGDEPDNGTLYTYIKMSQCNPIQLSYTNKKKSEKIVTVLLRWVHTF